MAVSWVLRLLETKLARSSSKRRPACVKTRNRFFQPLPVRGAPDDEAYWLGIRATMQPMYLNTQLVNSRRRPAPSTVRACATPSIRRTRKSFACSVIELSLGPAWKGV